MNFIETLIFTSYYFNLYYNDTSDLSKKIIRTQINSDVEVYIKYIGKICSQ